MATEVDITPALKAFPRDTVPYPQQQEIIKGVFLAAQTRSNMICESPTGTGKTLALLVATLAVQQSEAPADRSPILYLTRTHDQITNVVRELRRTAFASSVKMSVLGARSHYCVNEAVCATPETIDEQCTALRARSHRCAYELRHPLLHDAVSGAWDIEDLVTAGKSKRACPYFASREMAKKADMVIMPYTYYLDCTVATDIETSNAIVVIDEGHNLDDAARNGVSYTGPTAKLLDACDYLSGQNEDAVPMAATIQAVLRDLCERRGAKDTVLGPDDDLRTLCRVDLPKLWLVLQAAIEDLNAGSGDSSDTGAAEMAVDPGVAVHVATPPRRWKIKTDEQKAAATALRELSRLVAVLQIVKDHPADYRVIAQQRDVRKANAPPVKEAYVSVTCMWAGIGLDAAARRARCVIVASGTLAPTAAFVQELGLDFPITVTNSHVIPATQLLSMCLPSGPRGVSLNSAYDQRGDTLYDEFGEVLREVAAVVPNGVLVFVPSYAMLADMHKRWQETCLWKKLLDAKHDIILESPDMDTFTADLQRYRDAARTTGAMLIGVYRGKAAEGTDFPDEEARCVIAFGVPYPSMTDAYVQAKRAYNDSGVHKLLPGRQWYSQQAERALNQAIGRCVRHQRDWGAVVFCDPRVPIGQISQWVRGSMRRLEKPTFAGCIRLLRAFVSSRQCRETMRAKRELEFGGGGDGASQEDRKHVCANPG